MTDERTSRPVSGEIMFDPARGTAEGGAKAARDRGDVVDADFESLSAPAAAPRAETPQPAPAAPSAAGMDILKAAPARESSRGGPLFWVVGLALVAGAFWVSGGHALVSKPAQQPPAPAAEPDPRSALRIVGVTSRIDETAGRAFLLVDGEVLNTGARPAILPSLDIAVTDAQGRSTRYVLGTGERRLGPSARFPFSGRLDAPSGGVGTVTVDFSQETN